MACERGHTANSPRHGAASCREPLERDLADRVVPRVRDPRCRPALAQGNAPRERKRRAPSPSVCEARSRPDESGDVACGQVQQAERVVVGVHHEDRAAVQRERERGGTVEARGSKRGVDETGDCVRRGRRA